MFNASQIDMILSVIGAPNTALEAGGDNGAGLAPTVEY